MKKKLKSLTLEEEVVWKTYSENISKIGIKHQETIDIVTKTMEVNFNSVKEIDLITDRNNSKQPKPHDFIGNKHLVDKKVYSKLKNGQLRPTKVLDLHGLRYEDAKAKVFAFIMSAYSEDHRLVLIITGKGKKPGITKNFFDDKHKGILRQAFPSWLESSQVKSLILNVTNAHFSHGGEGAFYVYLRKKRHHRT